MQQRLASKKKTRVYSKRLMEFVIDSILNYIFMYSYDNPSIYPGTSGSLLGKEED